MLEFLVCPADAADANHSSAGLHPVVESSSSMPAIISYKICPSLLLQQRINAYFSACNIAADIQ
jgi:hypothetical protein